MTVAAVVARGPGRASPQPARLVHRRGGGHLISSAFIGAQALLLPGFDWQVMPIRVALRRIGVVIKQLEEGPWARGRTEDAGMPAGW